MIKRRNGFSLVELLIVMAMLGLVLAAVSQTFVGLLRNYKQQSKIAETNIEGIIGLDMLRRDIESAGYGLPWIIPTGVTYQEAQSSPASTYNDSTTNPPRPIIADDGAGYGNSDYLVIKSADVAGNHTSTKWCYLPPGGVPVSPAIVATADTLQSSDRVIVLSPGTGTLAGSRTLIGSTLYSSATLSSFADHNNTRLIYGINSSDISRPFNRADYYIGTTGAKPQRCAQGTGTLYKAVLSQSDGTMGTPLPLLDCVADMQIVSWLTTSTSITVNVYMDGTPLGDNAAKLRSEVKEIHVFILAQEGQRDPSYTQPSATIQVGEVDSGVLKGRIFNFVAAGIADWQHYRWRVYTLVIRPYNLNS